MQKYTELRDRVLIIFVAALEDEDDVDEDAEDEEVAATVAVFSDIRRRWPHNAHNRRSFFDLRKAHNSSTCQLFVEHSKIANLDCLILNKKHMIRYPRM